MKKEISNQELNNEYVSIKGNLDRLRSALVDQLYILFEKNTIQLGFPIQHRTKEFQSISEKISSGRYTPKKSVQEFQDLIGLRIILLFKRDIEILSSILEKTLTIKRKYDTSDKLKDDQFGYSSLHYVAELPNEWLTVPAFTDLGGIQVEIQVRTLSQHSWAEASRILQYKHEGSAPKQLLRSIGRVSALLETVDLEFERLLIERELYKNDIITESKLNVDENLNVDVLELLLASRLPDVNKKDGEKFEILLYELKQLGIDKTAQLNSFIDQNLDLILQDNKRVVDEIANGQSDVHRDYDKNRIDKGAFYSHVGLIRIGLDMVYGKEWRKLQEKKE